MPAIPIINVGIGCDHEGEVGIQLPRVGFPLPVIVAVPRHHRRPAPGLADGLRGHPVLPGSMVQHHIIAAACDPLDEPLAATLQAQLLARLYLVEVLDAVAHIHQRVRQLKVLRVECPGGAGELLSHHGKDSHPR